MALETWLKKLRRPKGHDTEQVSDASDIPSGQDDTSASEGQPQALWLGDQDLHFFNEGSHVRLYEKMGAHPAYRDGQAGSSFVVWAPNAEQVSVIGDFNGWEKPGRLLQPQGQSGVWAGFVPDVGHGAIYKYHIVSRSNDYRVDKADPFAFHAETPPKTGSIVWDLDYRWNDHAWMADRGQRSALDRPIAIYELHLGSWRRMAEDDKRSLSYRELAPILVEYMQKMGFSHVELLPIMEHPFYGSWGYEVTGYFAPTSRYGAPQDLMYLIDTLHQHGIGVILDWVPAHFPKDEHGLGYFDGSHLFEHADPRQGVHPDWDSLIFNYGRNEVCSFLLSNALFWLDRYHFDGLRIDAVASMLYLDYSREEGEWIPNEHGGRENLEALAFLRRFNEEVYKHYPDVQTIAEESTSWPMVSRPLYVGGLGFGMKWDMGWMHDTLDYMARDPIHRCHHHNQLTFRMMYASSENFVLPLSHDEVVHGKGSLLGKMPGDEWQRFANLRVLLGYMYAQPGKKLLFMGGEFGQQKEWNHDDSLEWHLLEQPLHAGLQRWVADLNRLYRDEPALYQLDYEDDGFAWIDCNDAEQSVLTFLRKGQAEHDTIVVVCNFTPEVRRNYRVGVPFGGVWQELLNSDAAVYGGSRQGNLGTLEASPVAAYDYFHSLSLSLPPLSIEFLKSVGPEAGETP